MDKHTYSFIVVWSTLFVLAIVGLVYTSSPKLVGERVVLGQKYTAVLHAQTTQGQK